jgi:hypothetical protein
MFRQIICTLIAANIVVCPLICGAGQSCCGKERATTTHNCCDNCHNDAAEQSPDSSSPDQPAPKHSCQCICGGAVIEDNSLPPLHIEAADWIALPTAPLSVDPVADSPGAGYFRTPFPSDGSNPGRAKRCLMMSFLC